MLMQLALRLFLSAGLGSFMPRGRLGSSRHSLSYSYLEVSESSQRVPQFSSMVLLDVQPIARYNFSTGKLVPLVPWMEEEEAQMFVVPEMVFRADLEWLSKLNPQIGGLHTWQVTLGCELREDGSKGGFLHYGYNGGDFISFDKETLGWVTAQPQAQKVKEKWEKDPARSERIKFFLENNCLEWLEKCLSYRKKTAPVGKVTRKVVNDRLEVLNCQAFGFYPKEIQATWRRDGEVCKSETLHRNVTPNSDGTYYVQLSIEIDPKERDRFRCHLEHEGLQKPLVLAWKEETDMSLFILMGMVMTIIFISVNLFIICYQRKYREKLHTYGTEDEIQSQTMFPPKRTSKGCCGQKTELRKGEKRHLMASPDAYSDKVKGAALEISEEGSEECLEDANAPKPGMERLEEAVSPGASEGPSEEQADDHLAGEEMGETQL